MDPQELELWLAVSHLIWVQGTGLGSSSKAGSTLNSPEITGFSFEYLQAIMNSYELSLFVCFDYLKFFIIVHTNDTIII